MKLTMLRGRATKLQATGTTDAVSQPMAGRAHEPAAILAWPADRFTPADDEIARPEALTITAEVRMRRFADGRVDEERYEIGAIVAGRSPRAILASLAERLAALDLDDRDGERVIVDVRVVA